MNDLLKILTGGDVRSDGKADEVAEKVLLDQTLFDKLFEGLKEPDDMVRGRVAHALEKISRTNPEMLFNELPALIDISSSDEAPMVKWHMAMIFGHLAIFKEETARLVSILFRLLDDQSVFVKSWAIVSLCIIGRLRPAKSREIIDKISTLESTESVAIKSKVQKASNILRTNNVPFPKGWVKSEKLSKLSNAK